MASQKTGISCSFCDKSSHDVNKIIAGDKVYICNECVLLCVDILIRECGISAIYFGERLKAYRHIPLAKLVTLLPATASVSDLIEMLPDLGDEAKLRKELDDLRLKKEAWTNEIASAENRGIRILTPLEALTTQRPPSG